jgi:alkylhydroperoxidase/carboxymuconolactone decarboxylase family protein YurZ
MASKLKLQSEAEESGPWDSALTQLHERDPAWATAYTTMTLNPWIPGVLPEKLIELIGIGLNAACTNLNPDGTRRHIRAALKAGATREEILFVLKCASVMAIHSCSLGAPILLEEAKLAGVQPGKTERHPVATPACDKMREAGQWNAAWDSFIALDPVWTDAFVTAGAGIYGSGVMPVKELELLSIAFDASFTHMYAPGTRRHIKGALQAGATIEEIDGGPKTLRRPGGAGL